MRTRGSFLAPLADAARGEEKRRTLSVDTVSQTPAGGWADRDPPAGSGRHAPAADSLGKAVSRPARPRAVRKLTGDRAAAVKLLLRGRNWQSWSNSGPTRV